MVERMELAARIAEAREGAKLGQAEVAGELGLPRSAVSKMETGEQRIEGIVLARMSDLYGVSVSELLAEESGRERSGLSAEALLRSAGEVSPGDRRVLDEFLSVCRDYAALKDLAGSGRRDR